MCSFIYSKLYKYFLSVFWAIWARLSAMHNVISLLSWLWLFNEYFKQRFPLCPCLPSISQSTIPFFSFISRVSIIIIFGCTFEWRTNHFRPNKVNYEDLCRGIFTNGFNELHKIIISDWIWKRYRHQMPYHWLWRSLPSTSHFSTRILLLKTAKYRVSEPHLRYSQFDQKM